MKTQKVAKIRRTRNSAQVGDTLIYEPQAKIMKYVFLNPILILRNF
jgi:hypothetical protein